MSTLRDSLIQYVAVRRALGTKLQEPARTLGHFVDSLESQGMEFITTELTLRWAMQPNDVQRATWARRLSMVRRFAVWLSAADSRTQVPPHRLIDARRRRNPPHIFTDNEVKQLMVEASRLHSPKRLRAHTYKTLIGLLATSGLRPGEALTLARPDVDLQSGMLFIRETKFGKSRFVPIHESTRAALMRYVKRRDELGATASDRNVLHIRSRFAASGMYGSAHVRENIAGRRSAGTGSPRESGPRAKTTGFSTYLRDTETH